MATPAEIADRMVRQLSITEPELDTSPGTPIRKILDTVAEAAAELTVDAFMATYQYDIDTREGADLDAFAALFGFFRLQAQRSGGYILLQRTTPAPESILIPPGSQASTGGTSPVLVRTLVPALFPKGNVVLEVPVEAIVGGSQGDLAAGAITRWLTPIEGITSITNPSPLTGGADVETDAQFRDRIKRTIFRNLAGTKDMYLGLALGQKDTSYAEVYGPYERWIERIEIVGGVGAPSIATPPGAVSYTVSVDAGGTISTIVPGIPNRINNGDYVYITGMTGTGNGAAFNGFKRVNQVLGVRSFKVSNIDTGAVVAGTGNTGTGTMIIINRMAAAGPMGYAFGIDIDQNNIFPKTMYSVDFSAAPPRITVLDTDTIPDGVYEFSFIYATQGSRNTPFKTTGVISDRIDVWLDGETVEQADVVAVLDGNNILDWTSSGYPLGSYLRRNGQRPAQSSMILPLPLAPIVSVPSSISLGSQVYTEGTDYHVIDRVEHDLIGSMESVSGIEFVTPDASATIASGTNATPVVLTTSAPHTFKVGQRVRVEGYSRASVNGDWYITAVGASTITLGGSTIPGGTGSGGTVRMFHPVSISYPFNRAPLEVQRDIEEWRLAGTDVLVHKARLLPLKFFFAVILNPGFTTTSVQSSIESALAPLLRSVGIGGILQISDVLSTVSQVSGIDSVRMLSGADAAPVTITGITYSAPNTTVTTASAHNLVAGDLVDISGVAGATSMNAVWYVSEIVTSTQFRVLDGSLNSAYTSGGVMRKADYAIHIMSVDGTRPIVLVADRTQTPSRVIDVHANETEQFVLHSVDLTVKAQNTWGVN